MMIVVYYFISASFHLLSLLPLWMHYLLSDVLYLLLYHVVRYRLKVVRNNLSSSFPEKSQAELRQIERDFYHWFGDYLVESVKLLTISQRQLRKRMVFKGMELIDQCVEEGQSCAIYLGHYCNWEWITSLPLWITPKAQCGQVYHPLENKEFDRLFLCIRQRQGAVCIPMAETLRRIFDYQLAGRPVVIGYISDQVPYWQNIHHWCDFLSHDTPVLTGVERIVKKLDHAVFYADVHRISRGYYETEFKLVTREPNMMPEFSITDAYFKLLEETIRRAPAYWLWSHNRWKRTREKFNNEFEVINGRVVPRKTLD